MAGIEWALNKTLVLAAAADRPAAREHDISLYAPLHSCLWKITGAWKSPAIGEYRTLDNKESSDNQNEDTIVLSACNRRDIKELFVKVTCKSSDNHNHNSNKGVIRKSDQLNEGTEKGMDRGEEILTQLFREYKFCKPMDSANYQIVKTRKVRDSHVIKLWKFKILLTDSWHFQR